MNKKQLCKCCGEPMDENAIGEHYTWEECVKNLVKKVVELENKLSEKDDGIKVNKYKPSVVGIYSPCGHCEWEWQDEEEAYYVTECGKSFMFINGDTLSEDKYFTYCPYCGKVIKETEYDSSYDSLIPDEKNCDERTNFTHGLLTGCNGCERKE